MEMWMFAYNLHWKCSLTGWERGMQMTMLCYGRKTNEKLRLY